MKILLTGATGFLGSNLCRQLQEQGHELIQLNSKSADLTKSDALLPYKDVKLDQVYHLAAWTQAGDFCLTHQGEQWIINQQINTTVLAWWQRYQPQAKLISMGTSCAYAPEFPLREENYLVGTPIESLFTYAMTKRMLLVGQQALHRQFGLRYLCLVPSTLYGPGYHTDDRQMHFIFDLIRKILRAKRYGEEVVLWGDGYQKRELVYVTDFSHVAASLASSLENNLVNIGSGEEFTIRDFARIICEIVEFDFELIRFDTSRYVGARSKCLDVSKLNQLLPNLELTPLREGLRMTIDWFLETGHSI